MGYRTRALVFLAVAGLVGCAGPLALEIALTDEAEADYRTHVVEGEGGTRSAFLAWYARREGVSPAEFEARDEALQSNPFERGDRAAIALGAAVYAEHCMSCHGFDARGGGPEEDPAHPAKDFTSGIARLSIDLNDGVPPHWFDAVYDGKGPMLADHDPPARAMPAYRDELSRTQVWAVLHYLGSKQVSK